MADPPTYLSPVLPGRTCPSPQRQRGAENNDALCCKALTAENDDALVLQGALMAEN
jgi:hypothetical protein